MATKPATKKNVNKKDEAKKTYQSPTEKWWGKAIIWVLLLAMIGGVIFGLVQAIQNL